VKVRAAIGVPGGQLASQEVRAQCERALADGADEIAIMPDHSALVDPIHPEHALDCIAHVIDQAGWAAQTNTRSSVELTLILETMWLGPDRLAPLLNRCEQTPIGFVQTSAGLDAPILTESHVRFLREHTPESIGVIAVGDVASFDVASALLSAGASRLGSAGALAIVEEERRMIEQRRATT
jgi:deoxyribose-phosphate aldolase